MKFGKLLTIVFVVFGVLAATKVSAESFVITGNGSGSSSTVLFDAANTTNIQQTNTGSVNNNVHNSANTGGNSAQGGSITTGNASSNVNITNNLNTNSATVACCVTGTPSPMATPTPTGGVGGPNPTPTPTPGPGGGGNGHNGGGNGGGGNGGPSGGGQVLGLAAASGEPWTEYLFYSSAVICLVAAKKLLTGAR